MPGLQEGADRLRRARRASLLVCTVPNLRYGVSSSVLPGPQVSSRTQNALASCPHGTPKFLSAPRMRDPSVTRRDACVACLDRHVARWRGLRPLSSLRPCGHLRNPKRRETNGGDRQSNCARGPKWPRQILFQQDRPRDERHDDDVHDAGHDQHQHQPPAAADAVSPVAQTRSQVSQPPAETDEVDNLADG